MKTYFAAMQSSFWFGPHARLVGMAVLWGASWPAGRVLAQSMPPLAASALRFLLAAMVLLPWMYRSGGFAQLRHWPRSRWLGMAAAASVGVFGYAAFFLSGLQHIPSGKAALVVTLNPVLTLALAVWVFKERINRVIGTGMALAVVGAVIVISHGDPQALLGGQLGVGELLILGCVACWAAYTLIGRWVLTGVDALSTTTITSCFGALMLLAASLVAEGPAALAGTVHAAAQAWGALVFLSLCATALAYAWYFDGVKALGAGAASGYITLVPVFGVIFSAMLLGEKIDGSMLLGGALAVLGTAVMNWGRRPASKAPLPKTAKAASAA
jgi:drug/metabolite transporter (DMT)-like permease